MIDLAPAYGFGLVVLRTSGLVMTSPVTSEPGVPARVRIAVAFAVSLACFLGAGSPSPLPPESLLQLCVAVAAETALGALAGLGARFILAAAEAAGQLVGLSMGLGYGASVAPGGADGSATTRLFHLLTIASAVALGLHREAFAWLCRSLRALPPGQVAGEHLRVLALHAVSQAMLGIGLAVRIAFPVLIATTAGHAALGIAGRFSPQLSLQSIGFSIAILAGGAALYAFTPAAVELVAQQAVIAAAAPLR
jgi:flagellar biosynthetic protein FliR